MPNPEGNSFFGLFKKKKPETPAFTDSADDDQPWLPKKLENTPVSKNEEVTIDLTDDSLDSDDKKETFSSISDSVNDSDAETVAAYIPPAEEDSESSPDPYLELDVEVDETEPVETESDDIVPYEKKPLATIDAANDTVEELVEKTDFDLDSALVELEGDDLNNALEEQEKIQADLEKLAALTWTAGSEVVPELGRNIQEQLKNPDFNGDLDLIITNAEQAIETLKKVNSQLAYLSSDSEQKAA